MKNLYLFIFALSLLCCTKIALAQEKGVSADSSKVFILGEVIVKGTKEKDLLKLENEVPVKQLETFNRLTVSQAVNLLSGVTVANVGPRNESMVHVRGFDLRQVPVFIDGIPVYVPYDGYVDLGRFTTFDLAEVSVAKGFSSVLYGANNMGGVINLVSRRPSQKFELNGMTGWLSNGYRTNVNTGTNLGQFYVQAGISQLKRDNFPLSQKFEATKREDGGNRNQSYNDDFKFNIKVGYAPRKGQEYTISYINQQGKKGNPVYTGTDTRNALLNNPRFWDWPRWDKQSLYFISNTEINEKSYLKARLFYDVFKNQLNSYDDATYTTQTRPFAFQSFYDDYTLGGSLEYGNRLAESNQLKFSVHYKNDVHRENNLGELQRTMADNTLSIGAEDTWTLSPKLSLVSGISWNMRQNVKAENYNSQNRQVTLFPDNSNGAVNAQAGIFYQINPMHKANFSVAYKNRFATVKDRYSYRLGTAIPNPDLRAENALNTELNYQANFNEKVHMQVSGFYSRLQDVIQNVNNVVFDPVLNRQLSQFQNTGKANFYGVEWNLNYDISQKLSTGANYTYIQRENKDNPDIKFTDVPNHKIFVFLQYNIKKSICLMTNWEYNSDRFSTTYGTVSQAFSLLNLKASGMINKFFGLEVGVNNVLDANYTLTEGYPEAGRNYFINLIYNY